MPPSDSDDDSASRAERIASLIRDNVKPRTRPEHHVDVTSGAAQQVFVAGGDIHLHNHGTGASIKSSPAPSAKKDRKDAWRQEVYGIIWQRACELHLTSEQTYEIAALAIGRITTSLDELSDGELGKFYAMLLEMKRPSLE